MSTVAAVEYAIGACRCACSTEQQFSSDHTTTEASCTDSTYGELTWLVTAVRTVTEVIIYLQKNQQQPSAAGTPALHRIATAVLAWLKSMVKLPSKHVNFPSLGVYFSILSGLAPRMSVDAAPCQHAAEITSSITACARPYMV
jgi:hypothetical protein